MPRKLSCECGACTKCKHRAYMRQWYHRASSQWKERPYLAVGSGGMVELRCESCSGSFVTTARRAEGHGVRFCSRVCKDAARNTALAQARESSKPPRACRHCSAFIPKTVRADAAYCSAKCNSAAHQQTRKASAKIGARQERIDRAYIIARDGGKCHLCGRKVPSGLVTLDHLVPLARGGDHTAENLRVACLPCNTRKGARAANDQLLLVG